MVSTKTPHTKAEMAQGAASAPDGRRPWEDRTLSPAERYQSYYEVARAKCEAIRDAGNRPGVTAAERYRISQDPEANFWVDEFRRVKGETPEQFCWRIFGGPQRELLGKNYLGVEAWAAQGIDVGRAPPLPATITETLLNSECPLHPGRKIKDTHLLVLMPKTVNGEPYSAVKLGELCATRQGSGDRLMYDQEDWAISWKSQSWASAPQAESEWVLLPKREPDALTASGFKHFRWKNIAAQQKVHDDHYPEYREVKTVELMTAVLLYDLVNKVRLLPDSSRCAETSVSGGRVIVGRFRTRGLEVNGQDVGQDLVSIGRALARKL